MRSGASTDGHMVPAKAENGENAAAGRIPAPRSYCSTGAWAKGGRRCRFEPVRNLFVPLFVTYIHTPIQPPRTGPNVENVSAPVISSPRLISH